MELKYFYCNYCEYEDFDIFIAYSMACANGDVFICPKCKKESIQYTEETN